MSNIVTVDFRNDTLFAVERDDGVFVAVTPICKDIGVNSDMQRKRIQNDPILSEGAITTTFPSAGGAQETFCLRLDLIHGWLFTIDESRVKDEETRQRVLAYKRECYGVLFKHFYGRGMEDHPEPLKVVVTEDARKESLRTRRQMVSEARQSYGSHAARQLWAYLGLPMVPAMTETPYQTALFEYTAIKKEGPSKEEAA